MQLQFSHPSISDSEFVERIEQKKASFYRVAFGYTRNEDDALEVVQEAVCKAYTANGRRGTRSRLRTVRSGGQTPSG